MHWQRDSPRRSIMKRNSRDAAAPARNSRRSIPGKARQNVWLNFIELFYRMAAPTYTEFEWQADCAANGKSGEKLTGVFIDLVKKLEGVRSVCDLGCGNGHISGRLAALGYRVTGVDASESGIRIARRAYPSVEFMESLIAGSLGERLGDFDLVISSDVIEHLYRPSALLEAARSVLKPR